ncbi:MAG: PaaI family thioesterase [Candidatus Syntropharchaeia archaeon]
MDLREGYSKLEIKVRKDMKNFLGVTHGAAIFALADHAFAAVSNSHGTISLALNMNITYVSSPPEDTTLVAEGIEVSRTSRTALYRIDVKTTEGRLIASCQGIVYRKKDSLLSNDL